MSGRAADWFRQTEADLRHAGHALLDGDHEWACDGAAPFLARLADLAREFGGLGIGCDVIAFMESEARALRDRGDRFARAVFDEGFLLASREG